MADLKDLTVREIQIAEALKFCRHGQRLTKYLQARQDWRPSLPVKRNKK